jgi:hypothetical protein
VATAAFTFDSFGSDPLLKLLGKWSITCGLASRHLLSAKCETAVT